MLDLRVWGPLLSQKERTRTSLGRNGTNLEAPTDSCVEPWDERVGDPPRERITALTTLDCQ